MKIKRKHTETDNVPGTPFAVEDTGVAPTDAGRESSNDNYPVHLAEVTAVAPNFNGSVTKWNEPGDSIAVENY